MNAKCRRKAYGSRFNIINAFVDLYLAELTVKDYLKDKTSADLQQDERLDIFGIVVPYRAQANLITKILADIKIEFEGNKYHLAKFVEVNTVHKFQGNQRNVILFDTTDDVGSRFIPPMVDDKEEGGDDMRLVNVAVTRSKDKFILLGNEEFISRKHSDTSLIKNVMNLIKKKNNILTENILVQNNKNVSVSTLEAEKLKDRISKSEHSLQILVPDILNSELYLAIKTSLLELAKKGINVEIFTHHPTFYKEKDKKDVEAEIKFLSKLGVNLIQSGKINEQLSLIDKKYIYYLFHRRKLQGFYLKSAKGVKEIIKLLQLDEEQKVIPCLECKKRGRNGYLIKKVGRYGAFYGCSLFPRCKYTVKTRDVEGESQHKKKEDRQAMLF